MISYIIPTRDRPERLAMTLASLGRLDRAAHERISGGEVIIIDNASRFPVTAPKELANGLPVRVLYRQRNEFAAARNVGAEQARGDWLIMIDDDSHPTDAHFIDELADAPDDLAAIGAEILLPDGGHEAGGLPEVIIGCGAAIRRDAFLKVGGYDPAFEYYVEEYDLCAKFILEGWRVDHSRAFRALHHKVNEGRDFNSILRRLVRNNCWVMQRYAPAKVLDAMLGETQVRYERIGRHENAMMGFRQGMVEVEESLSWQRRREMSLEQFDRFTGLAAARRSIGKVVERGAMQRGALIVAPGKNEAMIRAALAEHGVEVKKSENEAGGVVIGTLSPGPIEDAHDAWSVRTGLPIVRPWRFAESIRASRAL